MRNASLFPKTPAEAQREFSLRLLRFEEVFDDGAPDWAVNAFVRGFASIPLGRETLLIDERSDAFVRGFMLALFREACMPIFAAAHRFASEDATSHPEDPEKQKSKAAYDRFIARIESGVRRVSGDHLLGDDTTTKDFIAGMETIRKHRLSANWQSAGNLATEPNLYIGLFWREFASLSSIKEAHFELCSMLGGGEVRAGSFESFRKRARVIGLTYPQNKPSS